MLDTDDGVIVEARRITEANDEAAARALVRRLPSSLVDGIDDDARRLQALADLYFLAGGHQSARRLYLHLSEVRPTFYWPAFQLGRIAVEEQDFDRADGHFQRALSLAPDFGWIGYELAANNLRLKDAPALKLAVEAYLFATPVELGPAHMGLLRSVGHFLYERGEREAASRLYEHLWARGDRDPMIQLRRGEAAVARGDYQAAVSLLQPLDTDFAGGDWALRSLAAAYAGLNRFEEAADVLAKAVARAPRNEHFLRDYLVSLLKLDRLEDAEAALATYGPGHGAAVRDGLRVILLTHGGRFDVLAEEVTSGAIGPTPQGRADLLQAVFKTAYVQKNYPLAEQLIAAYAARYGETIDIKLCRVNIAFATQAWADAERQLSLISEEEFQSTLELRVKRFEYCCFTGDFEGAHRALQALAPVSELPAQHVPAVLRFYAETNAWQELYEVGVSRLADGFDYKQSGYILFRAIRKTGSHVAALTEIERLDDWQTNASLRKLRTIVMEDMVHNGYMLDEILLDPNVDNSEALQHRLFFKMRVLRGDDVSAKDYAIYYCTNDAYLCATMVSITSLVENNRELMADASLFVAVDSSLAPRATELLERLSQELKVSIKVLSSDEIVPAETRFQAGYGMFTGGHSLADAAYYRIYVAQHLANQRSFKRALYIDSDTIVLSGLEKLFWIRSGAPLMARLEETRPEIDAAIRLHGLADNRYFNSGVLYFDLSNRSVREHLGKTIAAIADPQCKLLFQDQCALNVGFAGAFAPLREDFNYFIKPDGDGDVETGVVVHFLDRPKPWDPAYPSAICRLWYTYWHKLAGYVGSDEALQLYRAANRG